MCLKKYQNLADKLIEIIRLSGPISLDQYMDACLTDAEFGYYTRAGAFGVEGDFITAPEISQVFGELLGLWAGIVWQGMGSPKSFNLVELGPGRGTLMADALRALKLVPGALDACAVHLVELNGQLRGLQKEKLSRLHGRLHWISDCSTLPEGPTIILANEFLDALPIRQFVKSDGKWHERLVGLKPDNRFEYELADGQTMPDVSARILKDAKNGELIETRELPKELMPIYSKDAVHPIAALFLDYGHSNSAIGDTFQAVKNHDYCDPLENPGDADVTALVDFEALSVRLKDRGYVVYDLTSQGEFLSALGIIERAQRLIANADMATRNRIENQIARLISPDAMGVRFKVLGLSSPNCPPLPGLTCSDI